MNKLVLESGNSSNKTRQLSADECLQVAGGYVSPDGDINDFHPIIWPVIREVLSVQLKQYDVLKTRF